MNLQEFKAWFEGYTEAMEAGPTEKQWAKIKKRVTEITETATPYPISVQKYYEPYRQWWSTLRPDCNLPNPVLYGSIGYGAASFNEAPNENSVSSFQGFDSCKGFKELGKIEFEAE